MTLVLNVGGTGSDPCSERGRFCAPTIKLLAISGWLRPFHQMEIGTPKAHSLVSSCSLQICFSGWYFASKSCLTMDMPCSWNTPVCLRFQKLTFPGTLLAASWAQNEILMPRWLEWCVCGVFFYYFFFFLLVQQYHKFPWQWRKSHSYTHTRIHTPYLSLESLDKFQEWKPWSLSGFTAAMQTLDWAILGL